MSIWCQAIVTTLLWLRMAELCQEPCGSRTYLDLFPPLPCFAFPGVDDCLAFPLLRFPGTYLIRFRALTWRLNLLSAQIPWICRHSSLSPGSPGREVLRAFLDRVGFLSGLGGIRDLTLCLPDICLWSLCLGFCVFFLLILEPSWWYVRWQMFWDLAGHADLQTRCWT